ncbi:unknown [Lactobacillus phage Lb338-1]|uniref:Uncharacterized protein n=1 Tax=Lactobacillus phage Lb338-1 TaxID=2892342 RepID=C1KFS9_9CAUD|nr:hypothetical protein lb338_phage_169 [Lactobacillus phage Lb338-1]ACO37090.1 unknown [Lactobacillus phage Lb338-1]QNO01314.1 hypothetical protein [Lactobacillus phage Lbab1]
MRKEKLVSIFQMGFTMGSGEDKIILAVDYNTTTDNCLSLISFNKHYNPIDFWKQDKDIIKLALAKIKANGNLKLRANASNYSVKVTINHKDVGFTLGS